MIGMRRCCYGTPMIQWWCNKGLGIVLHFLPKGNRYVASEIAVQWQRFYLDRSRLYSDIMSLICIRLQMIDQCVCTGSGRGSHLNSTRALTFTNNLTVVSSVVHTCISYKLFTHEGEPALIYSNMFRFQEEPFAWQSRIIIGWLCVFGDFGTSSISFGASTRKPISTSWLIPPYLSSIICPWKKNGSFSFVRSHDRSMSTWRE